MLSWFDADALGSGYTDFVALSLSGIARPYVRIVNVFLGIERGYQAYESRS